MMSCERAKKEEYRVVVTFGTSLGVRCGDCWTRVPRLVGACTPDCRPCLRACLDKCRKLWYLFVILFVLAFIFSYAWIIWVVNACQKAPSLGLQDVSIRDMVVYQNATMATTDTPWQVNSNITVNLSVWNPNTVAGCFSTYRRIVVQVHYKGQQILQQQVPLGFGLKPRRSRPVLLDLQGDHFPLQTDLGSQLELQLQNASDVELRFSLDVRYMRNDRKAEWLHMACDVIAKTPASINSSVVNNSSASGLVWSSCTSP